MKNTQNYSLPLILVTSLFFLWGLAYGLLDVLNKHFQETLNITKERSTLLQAAYFGAFFLMALPAGIFMQKVGYRKGIITGLRLYALGALLFYPAALEESFPFFLLALFILACGLAFLETAANPYITVLGKPETSEFRLNLAQSFNGVGSFLGPIIGGALFFGRVSSGTAASQLATVQYVYIGIACLVLLEALLFVRTSIPEVKEVGLLTNVAEYSDKKLFQHRHFVWAIIAQFFYVASQVGIAALFINYCTERNIGIDNQRAAHLLSASLALFTIGRFVGTALMRFIAPNKLLAVYAVINAGLCAITVMIPGIVSIYSLMGLFFFESIMFPTIFALGVKNLGIYTKKGASWIIMSVVGGAIVPLVMGAIAQKYATHIAYVVPMVCFLVILVFSVYGYRITGRVTPPPNN